MTSRYKIGLTLLAALALLTFAVWVIQSDDDAQGGSGDLTIDDEGFVDDEGVRLTADGLDPNDPNARKGRNPGGAGNGLVGSRTPSGLDLSDPDVRESELSRLLDMEDWRGAARIVGLMTEPVPAGLKARMLQELTTGKRLQAMHVFGQLRDPSFVEDLFAILDNEELPKGAHKSALEALWKMPGAPADDVALQLESRLTNDMKQDYKLLEAIAARGGTEATRAMVEYVQRSKNPAEIPPHILQRLDLSKTAEGSRILSDALAKETNPKILQPLVKMAAKNGARDFTQPLIDLDRDGIPENVRIQTLHALSQIGDEKAIDYLLEKAAEPGSYGEKALQSVATISSADPGARRAISRALDEADKNPRPERAKKSLLLAIGAVGDKSALPTVAKRLSDGDDEVRGAAARAMGRLGPSASDYVPQLATVFKEGKPQTRIHVAVALGSIGGKEAMQVMERALEEKGLSPSLERTLKYALRNAQGRMGSK